MYQEIMCDWSNIYAAYKKAHSLKTNSPDVIEFDKNKLYNLYKIQKDLKEKNWENIFKYYRFTIYEPKERIVDAMIFEGRIVQHILCDNILKPYFEPRLIKENCACREDKGTDYAINLLKQHMVNFIKEYTHGWVLKIDVRKFFPSINRQVLKQLLNEFPDEEIKELLFYIIDNSPEDNGIPIGNQSSQWFALFYLNKIDRIIKEKYQIKYYVRYMDDLIIICESKEKLKLLLTDLTIAADHTLQLEFNEKTQLFPIKKGINFLGWKLYYGKNSAIVMKIANEKRKIRKRHIVNIIDAYNSNEYDKHEYNKRMLSMKANLNKGNTFWYQCRNQVKLFKMNEDKFYCDIIGHIDFISEEKEMKNGVHWGYIKIKSNGTKIKINFYKDNFLKIKDNYKEGNLIEVFGTGCLSKYNYKEKDITEFVLSPSKIIKINNEIKHLDNPELIIEY